MNNEIREAIKELQVERERLESGIYLSSHYMDAPIKLVYKGDIDKILKRATRVELFLDEDTNELFFVDKGDLETYWLRQDKEERKNKAVEKLIKRRQIENPFLK